MVRDDLGSASVLRRGEVFVLDKTTPTLATHDPHNPLTVVAIHFDGGPTMPFHTRVAPVEFLAGLVDRLLRCHLLGASAAAVRWLTVAIEEVRASGDPEAGQQRSVIASLSALIDEIRDRRRAWLS